MRVALASKSAVKLEAVKLACLQIFGRCQDDLEIVGKDVSSGINEQPVGSEETMKGMNNRLSALYKQCGSERFDYYVSVENGIEEVGAQWYDFAWLVIADSKKRQQICRSATLTIDTLMVLEAKGKGFDKHTAGSCVASTHNCDKQDPHSFYTGGAYTRLQILSDTLGLAFAQLISGSKRLSDTKTLDKPIHVTATNSISTLASSTTTAPEALAAPTAPTATTPVATAPTAIAPTATTKKRKGTGMPEQEQQREAVPVETNQKSVGPELNKRTRGSTTVSATNTVATTSSKKVTPVTEPTTNKASVKGSKRESWQVGSTVFALWEDGFMYRAKILQVFSKPLGKVEVEFIDDMIKATVKISDIQVEL